MEGLGAAHHWAGRKGPRSSPATVGWVGEQLQVQNRLERLCAALAANRLTYSTLADISRQRRPVLTSTSGDSSTMKAKLVVVGGDAKAAEIHLKLPAIIGRGAKPH